MADGEIAGCGPGGAGVTCCIAPIASAAARHFASFGKSRNDVAVPTPPFDDPLTRKITKIKVHILHSVALENFVIGRYGLRLRERWICMLTKPSRPVEEFVRLEEYVDHRIDMNSRARLRRRQPQFFMKKIRNQLCRYKL